MPVPQTWLPIRQYLPLLFPPRQFGNRWHTSPEDTVATNTSGRCWLSGTSFLRFSLNHLLPVASLATEEEEGDEAAWHPDKVPWGEGGSGSWPGRCPQVWASHKGSSRQVVEMRYESKQAYLPGIVLCNLGC